MSNHHVYTGVSQNSTKQNLEKSLHIFKNHGKIVEGVKIFRQKIFVWVTEELGL